MVALLVVFLVWPQGDLCITATEIQCKIVNTNQLDLTFGELSNRACRNDIINSTSQNIVQLGYIYILCNFLRLVQLI